MSKSVERRPARRAGQATRGHTSPAADTCPLRLVTVLCRNPLRNRLGMTLVEVMVALSILSVAAVIVLQALATIYRALDVAEDRSAVCGFAGSKMAELILRPLEKNELSFSDGGSFSAGPQRFEWEGQGRPLAFNPALGSVELKIRWHKGRGSYESDFSTLVSLPLEKKEPKMGETP